MTLTLALLTLHNVTHARVSVGSCALIINVNCYRPLDGSLPMFTDLIVYTAGCRTADTAGRSRLLRPSVEGCETGAVSRSSLARERWRE